MIKYLCNLHFYYTYNYLIPKLIVTHNVFSLVNINPGLRKVNKTVYNT